MNSHTPGESGWPPSLRTAVPVATSPMPTLRRPYGGIWLRDLAAFIAGTERLVARIARSHADDATMSYLVAVAADLEEWQSGVRQLMAEAAIRPGRFKVQFARGAEWIGRFKFNGHVVRRSPLSSLLELDLLMAALTYVGTSWATLHALAPPQSPHAVHFERFSSTAAQRREELAPARAWAARRALVASSTA